MTGDPRCNGARPVLLYGHGTNPAKRCNLADLTDDGNAAYGESLLLDVDSNPSSASDPYRAEKLGFGVVKIAVFADALLSGKNAAFEVSHNYHAGLLPFCSSAARTSF